MSLHAPSGVDGVLASSAAENAPVEPLDALLRQIVEGYFVLTDGQGSVSKWSEPAELLFGRDAEDILGQSFFESLLAGPLSADAECWRRFLAAGDPPTAPGRVQVQARRADGGTFPLEAVFVPVKLDEGFDFSLFLEDLGFELPLNLMLLRMRQQHPVVVRALHAAIEAEPQPWEGWRTAGTLVVFRPLKATPWVEEELAAREAARAEADAEAEERITNPDPGIQGNSVHDLDDAAAVVARLLSAMERIDDLERMAGALPAQVQEARKHAEASRSRAEAAEREASLLREDLRRAIEEIKAGGDDRPQEELLARLERLERSRVDDDEARAAALRSAEAARAELAARLDRAEAERARAAELIEARVAEAHRRADGAKSAFESRILNLEQVRGAGPAAADVAVQLEQVRAEHEQAVEAARAELAETLERIERERVRDAEAAGAELRAALERVEHLQRASDALHEQLHDVTVERHEAEGLAGEERRRLADLQRDAEQTRARIDALRDELAATDPAAEVERLAREQAARLEEIERAQDRLEERNLDILRAQEDFARRHDEVVQAQAQILRRGDDVERRTAELAQAQAEFESAGEEILRSAREVAAAQAELIRRTEEIGAGHAELARRTDEIAARSEHALEAARRAEEALAAQAETTGRIEALAAAQESFEATQRRLLAEQGELREWVEAARSERDQFRATTEHALNQLAEVRAALQEHESSISVQIPSNAVEHDELLRVTGELRGELGSAMGAARGEIAALREAEEALRGRLEQLASAGEAASARVQQLAGQGHDVASRLERVEGAATAIEALAARIDGMQHTTATIDGLAERVGAVEGLTERVEAAEGAVRSLDGLAARVEASEALAARVEEVAATAAAATGAREELSARFASASAELAELREQARTALHEARDAAERVTEIDRGAGNVLADVRAARDRIDEVATIARTAQESADAGRAGTDELRTAIAGLTGELQAARAELEHAGEESQGAREQAAAAQQDAAAAREESAAGRERLTALGAGVERLGEAIGHASRAAESAQTEATAARRTGKELAQLVADLDHKANALRSEMSAGRDRLQAIDAAVDRISGSAGDAGEQAAAARQQGAELRAELAEVRAIAEHAAAGIDAIRAEVQTVRGTAERIAGDAEANNRTVTAGAERLEAIGAEVTFALKSLDEIKAGLTSAGQAAVIARREAEQAKKAAQTVGEGSKDNVTEVFAQLLGLAAQKKGNSGVHRLPAHFEGKKERVEREPRHGFDDVPQPLAVLGLDGKFRELNPAFAKLVGYKEHEFAKATWPSPHDRSVYKQQLDELTQLASGEIESVTVQSTYMHGQGLMVPVIGRLAAVPGEGGLPLHLLLEAEDRHHA